MVAQGALPRCRLEKGERMTVEDIDEDLGVFVGSEILDYDEENDVIYYALYYRDREMK
ncbi:hypothetical protein [Acinetobacter baumannii]|uniref:hypothetical protein n=1 Tax=Acinetobacter baumannii TaxID=470 RepID=UPI0012AB003E|nr:hypothetical protein [Acinetobacter baumannii]